MNTEKYLTYKDFKKDYIYHLKDPILEIELFFLVIKKTEKTATTVTLQRLKGSTDLYGPEWDARFDYNIGIKEIGHKDDFPEYLVQFKDTMIH